MKLPAGRIPRQEDIAGLVGVTRQTVVNWETDKQDPEGENLVALAGVLQVTPAYLLHGEGELFRSAFERIAGEVDRVRVATSKPEAVPTSDWATDAEMLVPKDEPESSEERDETTTLPPRLPRAEGGS